MRAKLLLYGPLAALVAASAPAFANGGDFFEELSSNWNQNKSDDGLPFFGVVYVTPPELRPNGRNKPPGRG